MSGSGYTHMWHCSTTIIITLHINCYDCDDMRHIIGLKLIIHKWIHACMYPHRHRHTQSYKKKPCKEHFQCQNIVLVHWSQLILYATPSLLLYRIIAVTRGWGSYYYKFMSNSLLQWSSNFWNILLQWPYVWWTCNFLSSVIL